MNRYYEQNDLRSHIKAASHPIPQDVVGVACFCLCLQRQLTRLKSEFTEFSSMYNPNPTRRSGFKSQTGANLWNGRRTEQPNASG